MNPEKLQHELNQFWDDEIVPTLTEYIKIPNKSPAFDPDWEESGHMDRALDLATQWADAHKPEDSTLHVKRLPGRTPLIMIEIPGEREREQRRRSNGVIAVPEQTWYQLVELSEELKRG